MGILESTNLCMESQPRGGATVVFVCGSVDMLDILEFSAELEKHASQEDSKVVIEFTGLEFIGGAGLDAIVSAYDLGKQHNTRIMLAGENALVRRILEITRLDVIIPIFNSLEDALE